MKNHLEHDELEGRRFEEVIAREAYCLWQHDGSPDGRDLEYWFKAKEIIQRRVDDDLGPLPEIPHVVVNVRNADEAPRSAGNPMSASSLPPTQTIAHTIAEHQSDPGHRFHARGTQADGRVNVAAGERLQRVRSRDHAN